MRTIAHLSDLHFGSTEPALLAPLHGILRERKPDLVIVSGDITQRAKKSEFQEAQAFFANLTSPLLIVPGNHDIPLYSLWRRFFKSYRNYHHYISPNLEPQFIDDEIVVIGLNSVRAWQFTRGELNKHQRRRIAHSFAGLPSSMTSIVVTHHPLYAPEAGMGLSGGKQALTSLPPHLVDLLLSGHLHTTWTGHHEHARVIPHHGPLLIHAGTTISNRRRDEPNTFNIIIIDGQQLTIEQYESNPASTTFTINDTQRFTKTPNGWVPN